MAAKKKPTPKAEKPTPEPTPAEGQAAGVQGLALALHRCAHGIQAVGELASALLSRPTTADGRSCLERLVVAAEKQADARQRVAVALEAANLRQQAIHEVELAERKAKADLVVALLAREKACALELDKPTPVAPVGDAPQPAPASGGRAAYAGEPLGVDMTPIVPVEPVEPAAPTGLVTPPQA